MALAPYKNLPQEIESLKLVIDMRNEEIRDLRRQKIETEKQVGYLTFKLKTFGCSASESTII